jgi:hypothetical protein
VVPGVGCAVMNSVGCPVEVTCPTSGSTASTITGRDPTVNEIKRPVTSAAVLIPVTSDVFSA